MLYFCQLTPLLPLEISAEFLSECPKTTSREMNMANEISDPRGTPQEIGGVTYSSPSSYDGVHPDDNSSISILP